MNVVGEFIVEGRAKRLKHETRDTHARLDQFIMASKPFESRENYSRFVKTQYLFHRDIDALFANDGLAALLPDLSGRRRFHLVAHDLHDLNADLPSDRSVKFPEETSFNLHEALGWLYVAEGSNLGAAFLLKFAAKLGLNENFGARHLAGAPEGRGLHWRTFTEALNSIDMSEEEEARMFAGANAAFDRVHAYAAEFLSQ